MVQLATINRPPLPHCQSQISLQVALVPFAASYHTITTALYSYPSNKNKRMKPVFTALLFLCLVLTSSFVRVTLAGSGFCDSKCKGRCAKAGVQDRCLRYCGICCAKCNCVPSGTYGNKHECPCYQNLKNNKGKSKCP